MRQVIKGFYLLIFSFFTIYLPLSFAKKPAEPVKGKFVSASVTGLSNVELVANASMAYDSLQLDEAGLNRQAFDYAVAGWEKLLNQGKLSNPSVLAVADFSKSSKQKRFYILDLQNCKLLYHTLVAHGRNSGKEFATYFSNKMSSHKSSPGFYITADTYYGSNGYSLKLTGLEKGINDKAMQRAIVMHGADYVDNSYISKLGYIGRSHGCPAVPLSVAKPIINTLKGGACLYIFTNDQRYLSRSSMLGDISQS
jgi:hypothetical protein